MLLSVLWTMENENVLHDEIHKCGSEDVAYRMSANDGYSQMRNVLEFEPTE